MRPWNDRLDVGKKLAITAGMLLLAATAGAEAPDKVTKPKTEAGPALKYEQFRRRVEVKVAEKREDQITGLKRLLVLDTDPGEVPDIKFRLAELYYEKSQAYFFRSQEAHDAIARATEPAQKDELNADQKKNVHESKVWAKQAEEIYIEIRDAYPKYPRMPEVLFALGQNYWTAGRYDDAVEVYRDLIQNHKTSPLVADAWLAFGEYYFNEGAVHRALKSYEYAATDKRSRVYGFALYKQAWCYYNLSDWPKALEKFRATVYYSQMSEELSGENRISLAREAQKDFVKTYSHVGEARRAKSVLADLANTEDCKGPECIKLLEQLAAIWSEQGRFEDSASLYKQLIELAPASSRNPLFWANVVDLVSRSGDKKRVIDECRQLVLAYDALSKELAGAASGDGSWAEKRANLEEARTLAESTVRRLAQTWNREATKTRDKKTFESALPLYEEYMRLFPAAENAYEMRFQMADLLYKVEQFERAATAYRETVEADPKGKYLVEAAHDYVLAVEEHLKDLALAKPQPGDKQVEIPPARQRLIEACDFFAARVSAEQAKDLVKIKFKAAKTYYDHNHFVEALRRFDEIVSKHPQQAEAEYAANLVIDVHNLREDWERLYEAAARYRRDEVLLEGRDKLRGDLSRFGQHAKFKLIDAERQKLEKNGSSLRSVAEAYEEFQSEFPDSENADKALFNASVVWDALRDKSRADALRKKLLSDYKDSPLRADVAHYAARRFEEQAEYKKAADLFESFAKKYPTDPRARDAMYNAAVFYAGVGDLREATKLREEYLKMYGAQKGGEKEAAAIYFSIASDLERAGRFKEAVQRYEEFAKKFSVDDLFFEALWRKTTILQKLGRKAEADKARDSLYGTYLARKKKGEAMPLLAADYASRIEFERMRDAFDKYAKLRIARVNLQKPAEFKRSVDEKARAREQVIKAYTRIVSEYKQAYSTIASLHGVAESWDVFVDALRAIPCPRALSEEQCTFFKEGLEEQIGPARESAYKAYLTCVAKSNELNVFTSHSTACVKKLETLAPDRYPPMEERRLSYTEPKTQVSIRTHSLITRGKQTDESADAARAEVER